MFRRLLQRGPARWVAAAAVLGLTAATGLSIASPAHAEAFPLADNFSDSSKWTTGVVSGQTSAVVGAFPAARSAPNVAYLDAYPHVPAAARVFRSITLDAGARTPTRCLASVWLQPVAMHERTFEITEDVQVFLSAHSGGSTGRIISVFGVSETVPPLPFPPHWERVNFTSFTWPSNTRTITLEIAAYRGVVMADDLAINCVRPI